MAKLNDLQVAALLEEIACAMRSGTPVVDSLRRLQNRRLGRIARVAGKGVEGLERGESLEAVVSQMNAPLADQASAAVRAAEQSGEPGLMERFARQLRRRSDYTETSRLLWFYPILLLFIGYAIAAGVMAPLVRIYNGADVQWPAAVVVIAFWLQQNWWIPPLVAIAALILVAKLVYSRKRLPREARLSLFCETLADQVEHDVPESSAIESAAKMSGESELISLRDPTFETPAVKRLLATDEGMIPIESINVSQKQTLIAKLRYFGSVHAEGARRHRYLWTRFIPRLAMVTVGLVLTLSYAWWVIAPVYRQVAQW
ncbi:MAG: type II secretion system F family protein [Rubripirellula sp.]